MVIGEHPRLQHFVRIFTFKFGRTPLYNLDLKDIECDCERGFATLKISESLIDRTSHKQVTGAAVHHLTSG